MANPTFAAIDVGTTKVCTVVAEVTVGQETCASSASASGRRPALDEGHGRQHPRGHRGDRLLRRACRARLGDAHPLRPRRHRRTARLLDELTRHRRDRRPAPPDHGRRRAARPRQRAHRQRPEQPRGDPRRPAVLRRRRPGHVVDPLGMFGSRLDVETHVVTAVVERDAQPHAVRRGRGRPRRVADPRSRSPLPRRSSTAEEFEHGVALCRHRWRNDRHRGLRQRRGRAHRGAPDRRRAHDARPRGRAARPAARRRAGEAQVRPRHPLARRRGRGGRGRRLRLRGHARPSGGG